MLNRNPTPNTRPGHLTTRPAMRLEAPPCRTGTPPPNTRPGHLTTRPAMRLEAPPAEPTPPETRPAMRLEAPPCRTGTPPRTTRPGHLTTRPAMRLEAPPCRTGERRSRGLVSCRVAGQASSTRCSAATSAFDRCDDTCACTARRYVTFISRHRARPRLVSCTTTARWSSRYQALPSDPALLLQPVESAAQAGPHEAQLRSEVARPGGAAEALQRGEHVEPAERHVPFRHDVLVDDPLELGGDRLQVPPCRHAGRVEAGHVRRPAVRPSP